MNVVRDWKLQCKCIRIEVCICFDKGKVYVYPIQTRKKKVYKNVVVLGSRSMKEMQIV